MKVQKVFISGKEEVPIVCHNCGSHKSISTSSIRELGKTFKVKCRCGFSFSVVFEIRGHYRKPTDLLGTYNKVNPSDFGCNITVLNLSKTGVGFVIDSREGHCLDILPGDRIKLQFTLDDRERTIIQSFVLVRNISEGRVGAEFERLDPHAAKQLGFYLIP